VPSASPVLERLARRTGCRPARRANVSILFVKHNSAQLLEVADRVNLARRGQIRFDKEVDGTSLAQITEVTEVTEIVISEVRRVLAGNLGASEAPAEPRGGISSYA
jgi:ABC-type sugar transport system ATPase subunit